MMSDHSEDFSSGYIVAQKVRVTVMQKYEKWLVTDCLEGGELQGVWFWPSVYLKKSYNIYHSSNLYMLLLYYVYIVFFVVIVYVTFWSLLVR